MDVNYAKLCDISANLKDIENSGMSKTRKKKTVKQKLQYLRVIKNDISEHKSDYPKISTLVGVDGQGWQVGAVNPDNTDGTIIIKIICANTTP